MAYPLHLQATKSRKKVAKRLAVLVARLEVLFVLVVLLSELEICCPAGSAQASLIVCFGSIGERLVKTLLLKCVLLS